VKIKNYSKSYKIVFGKGRTGIVIYYTKREIKIENDFFIKKIFLFSHENIYSQLKHEGIKWQLNL
jgi:hypothetical protein